MGFWRNCCISTNFFTGKKAPCRAHFSVVRQSRAHIRIFISHSSHNRHAQRLPQAPGVGRRISGSRKISLIFRDIFIRKKSAADFSSFATKMSRAERAPRTDFYSDRRKLTRRPPRRVCVVNIHKNIRFSFSGKPPSGSGRPAPMMPFSRNCTPLKCKRRCKTGEHRNVWFINKPFVCLFASDNPPCGRCLPGFAASRQVLPPSRTHTLRGIHRNGGIP